MKATINHHQIDLSKPIDISIPLTNTEDNPIAWYIEKPVIEPVKFGNWVGKVSEGSSTNFNNIFFNPHGHGTHTECLGYITKAFFSINQCLKRFFFTAELISVTPEQVVDDCIITKFQIATGLAWAYLQFRHLDLLKKALHATNPVIVALICSVVLDMGRKQIKDLTTMVVAVAACLLVAIAKAPISLVLLGAAIWALAYAVYQRGR